MKCTNCGNALPDGAMFCDNCGAKVNVNNNSTDKKRDLFCAVCGAKIEIGTEFCGNCGSPVQTAQVVEQNYTFCRKCGAKIPANSNVCSVCGSKIRSESYKNEIVQNSHSVYKIIIIILAALVLAAASGFAAYMLYTHTSEKITLKNSETIMPVVSATVTPEVTVQPTDGALATAAADKLTTYYVVNCNDCISLRETPSTSAKVLKDIPLGSPVSYVETSQNGYAKVIYNGVTGYALQSYLSDNPADVKKPINLPPANKPADNPTPANNSVNTGVVSNPSYYTYTDSTYNFSCAYPSHFREYNDSDNFVRYSLKAPDNTATLKICANNNNSGLSVETVLANFKSSYPGSLDYEDSGDSWCAVRTIQNGQCHYGYFHVDSNGIRGFEFHYDKDYHSIYDNYVNDIYDSLNF